MTHAPFRELCKKGPNFREPIPIDMATVRSTVKETLESVIEDWVIKFSLPHVCFAGWKLEIMKCIDERIATHEHDRSDQRIALQKYIQVLETEETQAYIKELFKTMVLIPADKAANNIIIVCKEFYKRRLYTELTRSDSAYRRYPTDDSSHPTEPKFYKPPSFTEWDLKLLEEAGQISAARNGQKRKHDDTDNSNDDDTDNSNDEDTDDYTDEEYGLWPDNTERSADDEETAHGFHPEESTSSEEDTATLSLIAHLVQTSKQLGVEVPKVWHHLASIYWSAKMHKDPVDARFLAAGHKCITKPVSKTLSKILCLVQKELAAYCKILGKETHVNHMWILNDSGPLLDELAAFSYTKAAKDIGTYDFKTLYTMLPQDGLIKELAWVVKMAFARKGDSQYININTDVEHWKSDVEAKWTEEKGVDCFDADDIIALITFLITNIYVKCGSAIFRQVVGIPMGTDCAPYLANLYLFALEFKWIRMMIRSKDLERQNMVRIYFSSCYRFIDDLITLNNNGKMKHILQEIYPQELVVELQNKEEHKANYLDMCIVVNDGCFITSCYDKRDMFDFFIVNFPHYPANIEFKQAHQVLGSQILRQAKINWHYERFCSRIINTRRKMEDNGLSNEMLEKVFQNTFKKHTHKLARYSRTLQQMVQDCMRSKNEEQK